LDIVADGIYSFVSSELAHDTGGDILEAIDCVNPWSNKSYEDQAVGLIKTPFRLKSHIDGAIDRSPYPTVLHCVKYAGCTVVTIAAMTILKNSLGVTSSPVGWTEQTVSTPEGIEQAIEQAIANGDIPPEQMEKLKQLAIDLGEAINNQTNSAGSKCFGLLNLTESFFVPASVATEAETIASQALDAKHEMEEIVSKLGMGLKNAGLTVHGYYSDKEFLKEVLELVNNEKIWKDSNNWPLLELFNRHLPEIETSLSNLKVIETNASIIFKQMSTEPFEGSAEVLSDFFDYFGWTVREEKKLNALCQLFKAGSEIVKNMLTSNTK